MSTHNLCFVAKIRNYVYPYKRQFYYIKVGCKGVFITRTCFHDVWIGCVIRIPWDFHIFVVYGKKK